MKVLITGATGSLGRVLVREACDAGYDVRAIYRSSRPPPGQEAPDWVRADLTSGDGLSMAVSGVDAVIHAASDPRRAKAVDEAGTEQLARVMRQAGVGHLIYISIVGVDKIPYDYYRWKHHA
ncbi:MAG TPA: NAD(P)H-binding protein [Bryobacteraceae bacterium]|jgi:nucleoside-diphosphate-sugar epimerase